MISNPIFIIGTERSGSNLLRLILNAHSNIAIPHPPHIMRDFQPLLPLYGDLNTKRNFLALVEDVVRVVNHHFAPWPYRLRADEIIDRIEVKSLYGIYCAIYEQYCEYSGKGRWGCKSTFMYAHINEIRKIHSRPKFIHLVRDPRAVVASAKKSIFSSFQPEIEARLWCEQQSEIHNHFGGNESSSVYYLLRYEDLVKESELTIINLMNFLEESFESNQIKFFQTKEAAELSVLSESWKNCSAPIDSKIAEKYLNELSVKEMEWIETIAQREMKRLNYPLKTSAEAELSSPLKLAIQELALQLKAESRSMLKDKNFVSRWKKKILLKQIYWKRSMNHNSSKEW